MRRRVTRAACRSEVRRLSGRTLPAGVSRGCRLLACSTFGGICRRAWALKRNGAVERMGLHDLARQRPQAVRAFAEIDRSGGDHDAQRNA